MKLLEGKPMCPGIASGSIVFVSDTESAKQIQEHNIVCAEKLIPPLPSLARKAAGFILKNSNEADHTVSYLKEAWKPTIIVESFDNLKSGMHISINGKTGEISTDMADMPDENPYQPLTKKLQTKIYLQCSLPWKAVDAEKLKTDGVGLLRTNLLVEETGKHPFFYYIQGGKMDELVDIIASGIEQIAATFYPLPVWIRTMDFASDELALYENGKEETTESNPLLGWRGLLRSLEQKELFEADILAIKRVVENGYSNLGVVFPMVRSVEEYMEAKQRMEVLGLIPHKDTKVGSMFETPIAALQIDEFIEAGLDMAFLGINDITQYAMAADRTNQHMCKAYNPAHPALLKLVVNMLDTCKKANIETTTSFLSPLVPHIQTLLEHGLTSFTLQADRIHAVAGLIEKLENKSDAQ